MSDEAESKEEDGQQGENAGSDDAFDPKSEGADSTLEQILELDPNHVYIDADLQKPEFVERKVNLIYRARSGGEVYIESKIIHWPSRRNSTPWDISMFRSSDDTPMTQRPPSSTERSSWIRNRATQLSDPTGRNSGRSARHE